MIQLLITMAFLIGCGERTPCLYSEGDLVTVSANKQITQVIKVHHGFCEYQVRLPNLDISDYFHEFELKKHDQYYDEF